MAVSANDMMMMMMMMMMTMMTMMKVTSIMMPILFEICSEMWRKVNTFY
jgi:hypothetical protein